MKKIVQFILPLLAILSLTSCEDVIQVKLDKGEPLVTIDAFVNDMRSTQTIRLTYTDDYFSQKPNTPVTGATVNVKDATTGQVFNFADNGNGNYTLDMAASTDTLGRVGHTYELTVTHQGVVYTSTTKMYRTTQVDSIDVRFKEAGAFGGEEGYKCSFLGFDPVGDTADYYWVKSYRNGVFFNKGGDINLAWNGASGDGSDGLPFIPPIAEGITPFGEVFQKYDIVRVEIHSISYQTYNFLTQVQTQTTNSGLFATTPENVKTNISTSSDKIKVVGWFNVSAVGFREKVVQ